MKKDKAKSNQIAAQRKRVEETPMKSEQFLQATLDALPSTLAILDETGVIIAVNATWRQFARANEMRQTDYGLGMNYLEICDSATGDWSEEAPLAAQSIRDVMANRQDEFYVKYPCHSPNEQRWFLMRAARIQTNGPVRVVITHANITKSKQAEASLQTYAESLEVLSRLERAILAVQSPAEIAQIALQHLYGFLRYHRGSITSFRASDREAIVLARQINGDSQVGSGSRVPVSVLGKIEDLRRGQIRMIENLLTNAQSGPGVEILMDEGVQSLINVPLIVQGKLAGSLNLGWDIPRTFRQEEIDIVQQMANYLAVMFQQRQLLEKNRQGQKRLQTLSRQLLAIQERERRAVALELHDQIGQSLTAIKLNILAAQRLPGAAAIQPHLSQNLSMVEQTLQQVRDLALDLRPSMLDDLGLTAALRWYIDRQSQQAGISAVFKPDMPATRLDADIETACFRVAQESLTNVIRHAQTDTVEIVLKQEATYLELFIRDEGVGFDLTTAFERAAQGESLGLLGMQERVELLGGHFEIASEPGQGCTLRATFPLAENMER